MSEIDPEALETPATPATSEGGWLCGPLGPALSHLRRRRDLTQIGLAETSGVRRDLISAVENGRARPALDTLERLLEAMEYSLLDLQSALHAVTDPPASQPRSPRGIPDWLDAYAEQLFGILLRKAAERFGGGGLNQSRTPGISGGAE